MKRLAVLVLLLSAFRMGAQAQSQYQIAIDQDHLSGAADFSFLNHPLTAADRLFVRDGHFHRVGKDGKPNTAADERVRLFGVNLAFGANFPEPGDAARIAKRLRRLGVNLVRLHHMDSNPDRDPNTANSILTTGPYPTLNPVSVSRLRNFLDALKAEGIYADLNLHVGYTFRPAVDHVPEMPGGRMPTQSKPLHIFHPRMVELQCEFTRKVIEALALRDDAVLGVIEIDNETSLLQAWQANRFDAFVVGEYRAELERQWKTFLASKYTDLQPADLALVGERESATTARANDWLQFLAGRDRSYLQQMLRAIRATAGPRTPVAGTQMGYGGLLNLQSQQDLDYDDHHFYIDHYNFPNTPWDGRDWRIHDLSAAGGGFTAFVNIAAARTAGRPYTVSEFNQPWPNTHGAEIDPELAAFAAFQDWDAIMHFAYSHGRNWDEGAPNGFNVNGDWTKFPNIGQSAWLFRTGAVHAGRQAVEIPAPEELALRSAREKRNGNIAPFLKAAAGYDPYVAFVHPVRLLKNASGPVPAAAKDLAAPYHADTGETTYDPGARLFLIHAPLVAGAFGFLEKKITAGAMTLEMAPSARGFAAFLLTSLDGRPLSDSGRMLLSMPGFTLRSQPGAAPPRPQGLVAYAAATDWWTLEKEPAFADKPSGNMNHGIAPVWMERVESYLTLRTVARQLTVYPLDGKGERLHAINERDIERVDGGFRVHLQAENQTPSPWYEMIAQR